MRNEQTAMKQARKPTPKPRKSRAGRDQMAIQHVMAVRSNQSRKEHAEIDPKTRRPKR
jgi:hypothetical protein